MYGNNVTGTIRTSLIESNRRRSKQIEYNFDNDTLPRSAKKTGSGQSALLAERETHEATNYNNGYIAPVSNANTLSMAAESLSEYMTEVRNSDNVVESLDKLIDEARAAMEEAAKNLAFQKAAKYRDRMYELQRIRNSFN
jgi:excinuclease ABC subunit B